MQLLNRDWADITVGSLKCLQRLLTYCQGKKKGYECNILDKASPLLYHEVKITKEKIQREHK